MLLKPREAILLHALGENDAPGTFLDVNEAACEMLGYSREEFVTLSPKDIVIAEQAWEIPAIFENLLLESRGTIELSIRRSDGASFVADVGVHIFNLAGQAIAVWKLLDTNEMRRIEQLEEVFASLAHQLSSASTPQEVARAILETADDVFGWDAAHLNLYLPERSGTFAVLNVDTVNGRKISFPPPPFTEPVSPMAQRIMSEGAILLNGDALESQRQTLVPFGENTQRSQSMMFVPIRKGEVNFGVLSLQSYTPNAFNERDLQALQVMADHCAGALDRTMAEAWLRQHAFLSRKFAELGKSLAGAETLEEAAQVILTTAEDLFGWHASYVNTYSENEDHVFPIINFDTIDGVTQRVPPNPGLELSPILRHVVEAGAQLILRHPETTHKMDAILRPFGDRSRPSASLMFAPMRTGDRCVGVISIQSYHYNAYSMTALEQFQALADHCAGAIARTLAQHELRASEARLRLVTSQIPSLLWTVDVEMRVTMLLGDVIRSLGLNRDDVVGRHLGDALPIESAGIAMERHEQALKGDSGKYEISWNGLDFHAYVEPLRDDTGKVIGCINVAHDITQRKQAEIALKLAHEQLEHRVGERTRELSASNAQLILEVAERKRTERELERSLSLLRATLESTTDGIVAVDREGCIVEYNQKWSTLWGFSKSQPRVPRLEDCILPKLKQPDEFREMLASSYNARETEFFEILELADGRVMEAYSKVQRVGGRVAGRVWSFRDVTLRRLAEKALVQSEMTYREAIENASGVPYRMRFDSDTYEFMGKGIEGLLGVSPAAVTRRGLHNMTVDRVVLDDRPWNIVDYQAAFRSGELDCYRVDLHIFTAQGVEKWINDCSVPIRDEKTGKVVGSLGILQDITPRKRQEEQNRERQDRLNQAEKLIALGTLVSGVAHEINNPNNFIMLNAPILQEAWDDVEPLLSAYCEENGDFLVAGLNYSEMKDHVPELFDGILQGAKRIRNIVQELRDFARPQPDIWKEDIDLNAVVNSALILLQNMIKNSTANFNVEMQPVLPSIKGSFQRLEQVVINLIQNACEALTSRSEGVFVQTKVNDENEVVLVVRDEGCGIDEENLKHVLDPFFTTKRDSGGTGLGLSITSNIVHDHGGVLDFTSHRGRGTTATLRFPSIRAENLDLEKSAHL